MTPEEQAFQAITIIWASVVDIMHNPKKPAWRNENILGTEANKLFGIYLATQGEPSILAARLHTLLLAEKWRYQNEKYSATLATQTYTTSNR